MSRSSMHSIGRRKKAARLIARYGMIDGAHHKQWLLDQVLRTILTADEYSSWREEMDSDPEYEPWDEGIAP